MKIYIVPMSITCFENHQIAVRLRKGDNPTLFMRNLQMTIDGCREDYGKNLDTIVSILGDVEEGETLQGGDILLVQSKNWSITDSFVAELVEKDRVYISEGFDFTSISIAAGMESRMCVCIADIMHKDTISTAVQIFNKGASLYKEYPAFKNIMTKDSEGNIQEMSLLGLVAAQDEKFEKWAEIMLLSMDEKYKTLFPVAKQILEKSRVDNGFNLLSKEEQVAAFLEFSKHHADKAQEAVPDRLIEHLKSRSEYEESVAKMKQAGLRLSPTQQFNVLQQVGYLKGHMNQAVNGNIIYNLSDMGAGKTLMTVQAIFMMDCISISALQRMERNEHVDLQAIYLADKHIIAPALSVKASWVDTFKLFYEVEKDTDCHYVMKMTFDGVEAISHLYIAPFTVRNGKIFVQEILPKPEFDNTYLIIDEIHQIVRRRISRTKFFVAKTVPALEYKIFALSGTMSNLKSGEWLSLIRFLGDTDILKSGPDSRNESEKLQIEYKIDINKVASELEIVDHRKFNIDDITPESQHYPTIKKKSAVEEDYFMRYGSKLLIPDHIPNEGLDVQGMLTEERYQIQVEPEESDNVSFELFYQIAATSAITAQSLQVAEELFGEQATQHKSSIIKTMSPFTDEEILILNTLHKIAADANKYRSPNIGRDINNAILNLNDGLQQKDLYTLVSGYAERNTKFLEYLVGLDINVLERLPKTKLITTVPLKETHKFHVLKELLEKDKDETFLIVVNDFYAMKSLADALGIEYLSKKELKDEMAYQELLDGLFEKQSIVIVTQDMIKSSLDLVQANRLVQYQLNTEVSDIIQTQNRINRIGQTRETKCFYIAADRLQNTLIELFLDSYRNIRVAHKGIVELFADLSSQIDVINDYLDLAFKKLEEEQGEQMEEHALNDEIVETTTDLMAPVKIPKNVQTKGDICHAVLFPNKNGTEVIVPLTNGQPFVLGVLKDGVTEPVTVPTRAVWNLKEMRLGQ